MFPGERGAGTRTSARGFRGACWLRLVGTGGPGFVGEHDGLSTVAEAKLREHTVHVRLDGGHAEEQVLGDLLVRQALPIRMKISCSRSVSEASSGGGVAGASGVRTNSAPRPCDSWTIPSELGLLVNRATRFHGAHAGMNRREQAFARLRSLEERLGCVVACEPEQEEPAIVWSVG
jgi:hypothetical protein